VTTEVANAVNQMAPWLTETQATAAVATTLSVFIALYVTVVREPRRAAEEARRREARMDTLRRAVRERIAAQARKVVPSCVRTPMFGDSWWTVRIDNASNTMTNILAVDVTALDANGFEVADGCKQANSAVPFDEAFDRAVRAVRSESLVPVLRQAIRDTLAGHLVKRWPRVLPPHQYAIMAYTTSDPSYELRITIEYEDEVGFQWQRTDTSQPTRTDQEPFMSGERR
jgi:hypothetical protein